MKVSELTESEKEVWQAAATGTLVDLRVGNRELDSPEKWAEWETERTIRAEGIVDLLIGDDDAASITVKGVRLQGARITGDLNLEACTLRCPIAFVNCSFASAINLEEASAASVRLSGSHVPALRARQLQTRGDLRLDEGFSVSAGVDLADSHIGGDLSCTGGQFSNPEGYALFAYRLTVEGDMLCGRGFTAEGEVSLQGAHIGGLLSCGGGHFFNPTGDALYAYRLTVEGDMFCDKGFTASGGVSLVGAHIGGLSCGGSHFSNPTGDALNAEGLAVAGHMFCGRGFTASGGVSLLGAHIGGLSCGGSHFSNPTGDALNANGLTVEGNMFCGRGFTASGGVNLGGAHIGGLLSCEGGHFSNLTGNALYAFRLTVERDMFCDEGFSAEGGVSLAGAHIGGLLDCRGGHFSNLTGNALDAGGLTVERDMLCSEGFSAEGEVRLARAHIGGVLNCEDSRFSNPDGLALDLFGATVSSTLFLESVELVGILNLTDAKTGNYYDNPAFWPGQLRLDGFVYDNIEGASAKERLEWLLLNERGYSPQIYEQLAAVYRSHGWEEDARRILIEKQRRRTAAGNFATKLWGFLLDWTVGYGYRTWLALVWLAGLLALGTVLFGDIYSGDFTPANKSTVPLPFQPLLYTLDLLLPVVNLHVRDAWIAHGAAQVWSVVFIIMGWILATALVLSLTGLLKRD